jgi:hypothetical protein
VVFVFVSLNHPGAVYKVLFREQSWAFAVLILVCNNNCIPQPIFLVVILFYANADSQLIVNRAVASTLFIFLVPYTSLPQHPLLDKTPNSFFYYSSSFLVEEFLKTLPHNVQVLLSRPFSINPIFLRCSFFSFYPNWMSRHTLSFFNENDLCYY